MCSDCNFFPNIAVSQLGAVSTMKRERERARGGGARGGGSGDLFVGCVALCGPQSGDHIGCSFLFSSL